VALYFSEVWAYGLQVCSSLFSEQLDDQIKGGGGLPKKHAQIRDSQASGLGTPSPLLGEKTRISSKKTPLSLKDKFLASERDHLET